MGLNRFIRFHAFCTFCLIIAGGLVTSNDYGLAVPDWPKSYGMWMPPMVGGVLYEHGHRMIGAFVGLLTIVLAGWIWFKEDRKWVRVLGAATLPLVILQGVLGGLTVRYLLPTWISTFHATLAQSFFSLIVCLALFTSRSWKEFEPSQAPAKASNLPLFCSLAIFVQLVLGAWMRHSKAALAIPTFPLAFGHLVPKFTSPEIAIHFAHRAGAVLVFALVFTNLLVAFRSRPGPGSPRRTGRASNARVPNGLILAVLLFALVCLQIVLGAYTVLTSTAVPFATAHVGVGALILATSVVQTLWSLRAKGRVRAVSMPPLQVETA